MRFGRTTLLAAAALLVPVGASGMALAGSLLDTKYASVRYENDSQLSDFLWRITGSKPKDGRSPAEPVKSRVDELVERVESLLDMYPPGFKFEIEVTEEAGKGGPLAHYTHGDKKVYVSPKTVTDGMLAHEIAHAVICATFDPPPSEKAQEILARYVDENLYGDVYF